MAESNETRLKISDYKYAGPLSKLEGGSSESSAHSFPGDLQSMGKWMTFSAYEYKKPNKSAPSAYGSEKGTIRLPIPPQLSVAYNQQYQELELGAGGTAFIDQNRGRLDGLKSGMGKQDLSEILNNASGMLKTLPGVGATTLVDQFFKRNSEGSAGISGVAQAGLGVARNPNLAALYSGTGFRGFQFSHKLIAKNQKESEALHKLIRTFKMCMAPSIAKVQEGGIGSAILDNLLFNYPYIWDIRFDDSSRDYLWEFAPSVLTDFTVNPHAEGAPYYFKVGEKKIPASYQLDFTFKEISIITREDIERENF